MKQPETCVAEQNTICPHRLNVVFSLKFLGGYPDYQTLEESRRAQRLKCFDNNKHEDIGLHVNNDNLSTQKFRFNRPVKKQESKNYKYF